MAEDLSRPHGHFAGRRGAKSRLRCGAAGLLHAQIFGVWPISNGCLKQAVPQSGRILLDPTCRNAYKVASKKEGQVRADFCGQIADPRIEAHRRGWMIHPRDRRCVIQGPSSPFFISEKPRAETADNPKAAATVEQVR